jgi:hypothetical protein
MPSDLALEFIDVLKSRKGQYVRIEYSTYPEPAAAHKGRSLHKRTTMVVRTGVGFENLASVQLAIASGQRGEVQPLKWGEWAAYPWVITHKGAEYLRLTIDGIPNRAESVYEVDGVKVNRAEFLALLTPAKQREAESGDRPEVLTVKMENIHALAGVEA